MEMGINLPSRRRNKKKGQKQKKKRKERFFDADCADFAENRKIRIHHEGHEVKKERELAIDTRFRGYKLHR